MEITVQVLVQLLAERVDEVNEKVLALFCASPHIES